MNSRHQVSNFISHPVELERATRIAMDNAHRCGTRALLVIQNAPDGWLESFALKHDVAYVDAQSVTDRADRISAVLGSEQPLVAMQLACRPDLGLLSAVAGTIVAGGLLILCLCDREQSHSSQRLLRLARQLRAQFPDRCYLTEHLSANTSTATDTLATTALNPTKVEGSTLCLSNLTLPGTTNPKAVAEQELLLSKACHHLDTHPRSCLVVRGRRGRGKSTLLARIATHLERCGTQFKITAMHESALRTYQQHMQSTIERYISPEKAVRTPPAILLVDEASSFALSKLQTYLAACDHLVLCTTTEGYETSGRALDVRLLTEMARSKKPMLQLKAMQPWRWAEDDPLEQFLDKLLLNPTSSTATKNLSKPIQSTPNPARLCSVRHAAQEELHSNDSLLGSVHALLLEAHYQTTPKDLEHLLDAPTVQLWIQQINDSVVGVILLEIEGSIEPAFHEGIMSRSRRLPHQLLPQLLAQTANIPTELQKSYVRIIRIAVVQELRRQGLATALLGQVTDQITTPLDAIGASFAADAHTMAFWKNQGYTEFHRGYRANPRTGKSAVAVLRSFDDSLSQTLQCAAEINTDNESARQAAATSTDDTPLQDKSSRIQTSLSQLDRQLLKRFAAGHRSKHDTFAALQRLTALNPQVLPQSDSTGRRQQEFDLRQLVQRWLDSELSNATTADDKGANYKQ